MILTSPAAVGLFQAILAYPSDDVPRLLLADVLEEAGEGERAEFIRVQCELANWKGKDEEHCPICGEHWKWRVGAHWDDWSDCRNDHRWCPEKHKALRRRERELLEKQERYWAAEVLPWPEDTVLAGMHEHEYTFRRGFVAAVTCTLADWRGEVCGRCEGDGRVARTPQEYHGPVSQMTGVCEDCDGTGRVGGHGPALVRAAPIEEVTLSDCAALTSYCLMFEDKRVLPDDPALISRALLTLARQEAGLLALA